MAVHILLFALLVLLVSFAVILFGAAEGHGVFWDNLHWTTSFIAAACLAWLGVKYAGTVDVAARRWLAWGLTANAVGQILWNLQVFVGQPSAPNVCDVVFFLVGPCFITGFLSSTLSRGEAGQIRWVTLDAAALSVAVLSVVLTLYLPYMNTVSAVLLLMSAAYPVTLLSAACVGLIVTLTLKAKADRRWIFFWVSLLVYGGVWMQWNSLLLAGRLSDGSLLNMLFSIVVLALGVGAMIWHVGDEAEPRWQRFCEGFLRMLPIVLVILSVTSVAVVKTQHRVPESVQYTIMFGALLVIILAMVRQSILLSERTRLLSAERKTKETEERYRILFEAAHDAIFIVKDTVFVDCNESALRMFGCSKEEILNRGPEDFSPELQSDGQPSKKKAKAREMEALAGDPLFFEWKFRKKQGREFDTEVSLNRIRLQDGELLVAVVRDVTERKQSQQALRMSDQKFSSAFENAPIGMALVATNGHWLKVNRALRQILGYSWDELKDKSFQDITHPEDLEADLARIRELLDGKIETYQMEKRYFHKDGHAVPVLLSVSLVRDMNGNPLYFISQIQDITQRKQLEEQFRQAQKMEALGTLAGGIAHDFNNILAAINGYAELARMETGNMPEACKYLDSVMHAGTRAAELVRQILAFSRQQSSKRVPIHMGEVVDDALKLLRATIPATIDFRIFIEPGLPPVLADTTQIHQIMMNLGTNAWHAMRGKTGQLEVIMVRTEVDEIMAESQLQIRPGSYIRLSVGDTGAGMEPALAERIFEPFFTTKAPGQGSGLGLSVVHGIMQGHEGAVHVYSQPGEGSVFHLYFPIHQDEMSAIETEAVPVPRGNGERILLVDDESALTELGVKVLEMLGYKVRGFSNVLEALEELKVHPESYDLIVTDQSMPKMSGTDFARRIQTIRPDLPIILSTGYAASLTPECLKEIGIRSLLLKPLCLRSLGAAVHEVLEKGKGLNGKNSGN